MMFQGDSPPSLSFSDLPISETQEITRDIAFERRPTTTPDEEFQFFYSFNDLNVKMCSPGDIFSQGKLRPFKSPTSNNTTASYAQAWNSLKKDFFNAKGGRAISHCSTEYRRLEKDPRTTLLQTQMAKRVSGGMSGRSGSRPKWYQVIFGSIKMPVEMEMSDIRSRQLRRSQASALPAAAGVGEEGKSRWNFLRALSCRGYGKLQVARVRAV